jgi:hypothetical protein
MCNGLCEKFNGVLKKMLKAYARSKPKTWDKYIHMKLLPWSVSISLGIPTLENKLIKAFETVLASWSLNAIASGYLVA